MGTMLGNRQHCSGTMARICLFSAVVAAILVCSSGFLRLYQHKNYRGDYKDFHCNRDRKVNHICDFNDKTSSLRVIGGENWKVYQHSDYRGKSKSFSQGSYNVRDLPCNDCISSILCTSAGYDYSTPIVRLYGHTNFRGKSRDVYFYSCHLKGFNDKASSARVWGYSRWYLYKDSNYRGEKIELLPGKNYATMPALNDRVTSLKA